MNYLEFLKSKIEIATDSGFTIEPSQLNRSLKPHQKDAVTWALRGGRRALFESFGLGKTVQELEFCYQASKHCGGRATSHLGAIGHRVTKLTFRKGTKT